ncbi:MAG: hypothetical protein R3E58_19570 [Phycisphaerae bacterium]
MIDRSERIDVPKGTWDRCEGCGHMLFHREFQENLFTCPKCDHHRRIDARTRIEQLCDPDSFEEFLEDLVPTDPLNFKDRVPYPGSASKPSRTKRARPKPSWSVRPMSAADR